MEFPWAMESVIYVESCGLYTWLLVSYAFGPLMLISSLGLLTRVILNEKLV